MITFKNFLLQTVFVVLLIIVLSGFTTAALIDGLEAYYKFDGDVTDETGNHDGTNQGSTHDPNGIIGATRTYVTNDYVDLNYVLPNGNNEGTISFWFKTSFNAPSNKFLVAANQLSLTDRIHVYQASDNKILVQINDGSNNIVLTSLIALNNDAWHHLVVTWANGEQKLYIDNNLDDSGTITINTIDIGQDFFSGARNHNGAPDNYWDGEIDELAFYEVVKTSGEVSELWNDGEGLTHPFSFFIINSTLNMTSEGGCIAWRTDKTDTCNTTDGTPTLFFETNVNADCSLRDEAGNYNAAFICSTTGAKSHVCTIYDSDKLVFGLNSLYASCYDGTTNSVTGAMSINMTAGSGGLSSCIKILGSPCAIDLTGTCAIIT